MYQSTAEFGNLVQQDSRTFKCLITYDKVSITTVKSIKFTGGSEGGDDFSLGSAMSQYVEVTVPDKNYLLEGKEILLQIGMAVNGKMEYIPVGYFTVGKPKKSDNQITFTAYDRMMKTERPFSMNGSDTNTVSVLKRVAEITGITVITTGLTAVSMKVPKGYSCREVLCYVAQLHGAFAVCNRKGQIELHTYKDSGYGVNPGRYWESFEHNEYTFDVSKLECYTGKDKDGNSISISAGSGARAVTFSNPFMTQTALNSVQASLQSFSYMPGKLKMLGDPRLDPWDILTIKDLAGKSYKVPIMKLEWEYDGGLTYSVEAVGMSEEETNSDYKGPQTKEMERYYAQLVMIDRAMINKLDVDTANITYATIKNLDVVKEHVQEITGELGEFKDLTAANFKAANAQIEILNGNYANIKTLMSGGAGIGDLQNIHLTTKNAVIDSALIRSAVIETVAVSDLLAGTISTNKFTIASDDGGIRIQGATQQWSDANGIVRMQAGRDANGDFTFSLFDKTGKGVLIDSTGIKENAITDGLIVNKMVADNAGIAGSKLDIPSVVSEINGSTETIKSSRIWFDEEKQTLSQLYSKTAKDIETAQKKADSASDVAKNAAEGIQTTNQNVASIKTGLDGMDLKLSETTSELYGLKEGTLLYNCTYHDNGDNTTTVTAVVYRAGKDVTKEFPESCYTWKRKTEAGEQALGSGYSITVSNDDYTFGGVVVGQFETDDDTQTALLTMQEGVVQINGKAVAFNGKNDFVDANSFAESKTIPEGKKLLFVDAETNEGGNITAGNFKKQILSNLGIHDIRVDDRDTRLDEVLDKLPKQALSQGLELAWIGWSNNIERGNGIENDAIMFSKHAIVGMQRLNLNSLAESKPVFTENTTKILKRAKELNPKLRTFEYLQSESGRTDFTYDGDHAHLNSDGSWKDSTADLSGCTRIYTYQQICDWLDYFKATGTDGVFFDDWGYDFAKEDICYQMGFSTDDYADKNAALNQKWIMLIEACHEREMFLITNGGMPFEVGDWYTHLDENDVICLESCLISSSNYKDDFTWQNGQKSIYNYWTNYYSTGKCEAKIWSMNYCPSNAGDYEDIILTYLCAMTLVCGGGYVSMGTFKCIEKPEFIGMFSDGNKKTIKKIDDNTYQLKVNNHTLEAHQWKNLSGKVSEDTVRKNYYILDGKAFNNGFLTAPVVEGELSKQIGDVSDKLDGMSEDSRKNAISYWRMAIDDWNASLIYSDYTNFISTGSIAHSITNGTIEVVKNSDGTCDIVCSYNKLSQGGIYLNVISPSNYEEFGQTGEGLEFGFSDVIFNMSEESWTLPNGTVYDAKWLWSTPSFYIYADMQPLDGSAVTDYNIDGIGSNIGESTGHYKKTSGDIFTNYNVRIWFHAPDNEFFDGTVTIKNAYLVDLGEHSDEISKKWYTNIFPANFNSSSAMTADIKTVTKNGWKVYDISVTHTNAWGWTKYKYTGDELINLRGHTVEFGCTILAFSNGENGVGSSANGWVNYAVGIGVDTDNPNTVRLYADTVNKSKIWDGEKICCLTYTIPESVTSLCIGFQSYGFGTDVTVTLKDVYMYDLGEEVSIRGKDSTNASLRLCRINEEQENLTPSNIKNALYITDKGEIFVTDLKGNRVNVNHGNGSVDELRLLPTPTAEDEGKTLKVVEGQWKLIEPASVDIKAALKENLTLDMDEKFIYLRYGTEKLSKVSLENNREPDGIEMNIAKGSSWFNSNNMPGLGGNAARAYSYVGSVVPTEADTTYSYGALLQKGTKYKIRSAAGECYYGLQIYSSATKIRVLDSGWQAPGTEYAYTPAEENLYLYINFKYGAGGSATITDEILSKLTEGFSITTES